MIRIFNGCELRIGNSVTTVTVQHREAEFLGVPFNQIFDFVTGQFVKILTQACS